MSCFPLTAPGSFHDTIMAKPLVLTAAMAELALEYAESSSSSAANLPAAELDKVRTYGLSCVLNVFMMVFCSTKNLDAASHHGKKAALYYTEFISQINQDGNSFLKLTPTDAVLFTYKKTIFTTDRELQIPMSPDEEGYMQRLFYVHRLLRNYFLVQMRGAWSDDTGGFARDVTNVLFKCTSANIQTLSSDIETIVYNLEGSSSGAAMRSQLQSLIP